MEVFKHSLWAKGQGHCVGLPLLLLFSVLFQPHDNMTGVPATLLAYLNVYFLKYVLSMVPRTLNSMHNNSIETPPLLYMVLHVTVQQRGHTHIALHVL